MNSYLQKKIAYSSLELNANDLHNSYVFKRIYVKITIVKPYIITSISYILSDGVTVFTFYG